MQRIRLAQLLFFACNSLLLPSCKKDNTTAQAQPTSPVESFEKHFGGSGNDEGRVIVGSSDGNYVVAGITASYGNGSDDFYVMKINPNGNKIWEKWYGGANFDWANDIIETPDGGYLIAGESKSIAFNLEFEAYFIKIDNNGNLLWEKNYGTSANDGAKAITACADHSGYVWAGFTEGASSLYDLFANVYLGKLNETGDTLWTKDYNLGWTEDGTSIVTDASGNFYVLGNASTQSGDHNLFVMKTNTLGDSLWTRFIPGVPGIDEKQAGVLIEAADGNLVICGTSLNPGTTTGNLLAITMDTSGHVIWQTEFGNSTDNNGYSVLQSADGDLVFAGNSIASTGNKSVLLVKTDQSGIVKSIKNTGDATHDNGAYSMIEIGDSWILTGFYNVGVNNNDLYILKLHK